MHGSFEFEIADDGRGFDVAKVLGPADGSTGLGLRGIRDRIELFGGRLAIESDARARQPAAGRRAARRGAAMIGRIRVLVADDHTIVRQGIVSLLRDSGVCEVVAEAANGMEAVEQAMATGPRSR